MNKHHYRFFKDLILVVFTILIFVGCRTDKTESWTCNKKSAVPDLPQDEEIKQTILEIYNQNIASQCESDNHCSYLSKLPLVITPYYFNKNEQPFIIRALFSGADQDYLVRQSEMSEYFVADSMLIKALDIRVETDGCFNGYNTISVPLFSEDRRMMIIYESYNWGFLSGYAYSRIYRKTNKSWEIFATLICIQS